MFWTCAGGPRRRAMGLAEVEHHLERHVLVLQLIGEHRSMFWKTTLSSDMPWISSNGSTIFGRIGERVGRLRRASDRSRDCRDTARCRAVS